MGIAELVLIGLIVGAFARLIVPGRQPYGVLGTMAIGIGGSLLGWFAGQRIDPRSVAAHPWLWAIGGAVLLVIGFSAMTRRGWGRGL